jgi:hypothetical protein
VSVGLHAEDQLLLIVPWLPGAGPGWLVQELWNQRDIH